MFMWYTILRSRLGWNVMVTFRVCAMYQYAEVSTSIRQS